MSCCEDHIHDEACGEEYSLWQQIDIDNVSCLNEAHDGSAKTVFKHWEDRHDTTKFVESDADEQLIVNIPFTANIKLKSISIVGAGDSAPSKMQAFTNRDDIDFTSAEGTPAAQEWELVRDTPRGEVAEYATRLTKFQNVRKLTLYFSENFGADTTRITYIGLKGEFTEIKRDPIVTVYELAANPADHKTKNLDQLGSMIQ
ncbi:hypothetical protein HDU86_003102 [Geranomyces michiganensis]|nr:hypothetical protein HDU86_003102 [Geranomyces michiganensis]